MSERPRRRAAVAAAVAMTSPARKRVQRPQDKKSAQRAEKKAKEKVADSVADLRHCWHFAALVQFYQTFCVFLKMDKLTMADFENLLCFPKEHEELFKAFSSKLLEFKDSTTKPEDIPMDQITNQMENIIGEHWELAGLAENPLGALKFEDLSAASRAQILYAICLYRLDNDDELQDYAKIMAEGGPITAIQGPMKGKVLHGAMRTHSFKKDSEGNLYFLFGAPDAGEEHCRVYRMMKPARSGKGARKRPWDDSKAGPWECICVGLDGYEKLRKSLIKSKNRLDLSLAKYIEEHVAEPLKTVIETREAKKEREEARLAKLEAIKLKYDAIPRKRSARLQEKAQRDDEEVTRLNQDSTEPEDGMREANNVQDGNDPENEVPPMQPEKLEDGAIVENQIPTTLVLDRVEDGTGLKKDQAQPMQVEDDKAEHDKVHTEDLPGGDDRIENHKTNDADHGSQPIKPPLNVHTDPWQDRGKLECSNSNTANGHASPARKDQIENSDAIDPAPTL